MEIEASTYGLLPLSQHHMYSAAISKENACLSIKAKFYWTGLIPL